MDDVECQVSSRPVYRSVLFPVGVALGAGVVYVSLELFDRYRQTEANLSLAATLLVAVILAWRSKTWRPLGLGMLAGPALFIVFLVVVVLWAGLTGTHIS